MSKWHKEHSVPDYRRNPPTEQLQPERSPRRLTLERRGASIRLLSLPNELPMRRTCGNDGAGITRLNAKHKNIGRLCQSVPVKGGRTIISHHARRDRSHKILPPLYGAGRRIVYLDFRTSAGATTQVASAAISLLTSGLECLPALLRILHILPIFPSQTSSVFLQL